MDDGMARGGDCVGPESAFGVPSSGVVHETIDGEVIIIALDRGDYFSLTGSGAEIWEGLAQGQSVGRLAWLLAERHGLNSTELLTTIGSLAGRLMSEGVLEPTDSGAGADAPGFAAAEADHGLGLEPERSAAGFQPPVLEKFTDMQDTLLVDPIHEVTAKGWPAEETG